MSCAFFGMYLILKQPLRSLLTILISPYRLIESMLFLYGHMCVQMIAFKVEQISFVCSKQLGALPAWVIKSVSCSSPVLYDYTNTNVGNVSVLPSLAISLLVVTHNLKNPKSIVLCDWRQGSSNAYWCINEKKASPCCASAFLLLSVKAS